MKTSVECIPCFIRQAAEAVALSTQDPFQQARILREVMHALADLDWQGSPPMVAAELHRIIREMSGDLDPYRAVKKRMNRLALDALPGCRKLIAEAADPFQAVIRLAVAGNLLDCGAKTQITADDLPQLFSSLWDQSLVGEPQEVFHAAEQADRILYLADNAGEIIFDRLLVEALPMAKVTVAVRGNPILNDALLQDARLAGITDLVPVIDNGSAVPGTVLADCSAEFRTHFHRADMIIAKGQGNYETLSEVRAPIFFLFTVKCPLVAAQIGEPSGSLIAKKSAHWQDLPPRLSKKSP